MGIKKAIVGTCIGLTLAGGSYAIRTIHKVQIHQSNSPVSSGRFLSPVGSTINLGSFPCNMAESPDHQFLAVTDSGFRESLSILDPKTGHILDSKSFNGKSSNGSKDGLYYGLCWASKADGQHLMVSEGPQENVMDFTVSENGQLVGPVQNYKLPVSLKVGPTAGIGYDPIRNEICAVVNGQTGKDSHGLAFLFDAKSGKEVARLSTPAYPLGVQYADGTFYIGCERNGVLAEVRDDRLQGTIKVGLNPTGITFDPLNHTLYVANSSSDTVSAIDTRTQTVSSTILVRPQPIRNLAGATPLGLCLAPKDHLLVALGDVNAVGIINLKKNTLEGLIPVGWYPSAVNLSSDGQTLIAANAKGSDTRVPNDKPVGKHGQYVLNILEGTATVANYHNCLKDLPQYTEACFKNLNLAPTKLRGYYHPEIQHVIYIIKENRTYDQVFGDIKAGNGDPSITMFGQAITPNEHALVNRFGLYDNFYTCADVSATGWSWSVAGMASEYVMRNAPANYSGRTEHYDFEGDNGGKAPDLEGIRDVNEPAGGYLWDDALKHHKSVKNFGFYVDPTGELSEDGQKLEVANKKSLSDLTDSSFREFDLAYADSDLWVKDGFTAPKQMKTYGKNKANSRFQEWMVSFKKWESSGQMPELQMLRVMRDHTIGTANGEYTPQAMVADNDYCVGEIVEAVSHSRFWKSTLICILEDDSQAGYDHVDCHRSTAILVSPYLQKGYVDRQFHNTDSMLHTIELALGLPPMNSYDANASPMGNFLPSPLNADPYEAIKPSRDIASAVNGVKAYRAKDSTKILDRFAEHTEPDLELNDILWGAIMGPKTHRPAVIGFIPGD